MVSALAVERCREHACLIETHEKANSKLRQHASLQVIESLSSSKPKQFVKTGLVRKVVSALCAMCAEPDPEDYEEDSDDLPSNKVASQVRDSLTCISLAQR